MSRVLHKMLVTVSSVTMLLNPVPRTPSGHAIQVHGEHWKPTPYPETLVIHVAALQIYLLLLFLRVLLSWFPAFNWERQPWLALRQVGTYHDVPINLHATLSSTACQVTLSIPWQPRQIMEEAWWRLLREEPPCMVPKWMCGECST